MDGDSRLVGRQVPLVADTFLGGAQKGGTTALAEYLARHPACIVSDPKEPHFFARASNLADPASYAHCFPQPDSGEAISAVIDASTSTLMHPNMVDRIESVFVQPPRFIFVLREPVTRAVAAYGHAVRKGFERRPIDVVFDLSGDTLKRIATEERQRVEIASRDGRVGHRVLKERYDDPLWQFRYLGNSDYPLHLQPFIDTFGAERVLILLAEDLRSAPSVTLGRIAAFLSIDPAPFDSLARVELNPTHTRRFNRLRHFLGRDLGLKRLKRQLPTATNLARALFRSEPAPVLPRDLRSRLQALYAPSYDYIGALTSCDPRSLWTSGR